MLSKNIAATLISAAMMMSFAACNNADKKPAESTTATSSSATNEESSKDLTGKFTLDGKDHTGKVSVQTFPSTKEFSVLCQDDGFGLVQITFADEASARTEQTIKFTKGFTHKEKNEADFAFSGFVGNPPGLVSNSETPGSAKIVKDGGNYVIEFSDVDLKDIENKTSGKLSGKIPY